MYNEWNMKKKTSKPLLTLDKMYLESCFGHMMAIVCVWGTTMMALNIYAVRSKMIYYWTIPGQ